MPEGFHRDEYPRAPQFSERDAAVLSFLGEEDLLGFTFEGLRRKMGTHSETLSRILRRLEDQQILEKSPEGYHVTSKGREMIEARPLAATRGSIAQRQRFSILHTLLPYRNSGELVNGLKGRWFGPLRWLGYSEDGRSTTMKWVTEDGSVQIDAIFSDGELTIEGSVKEGKDLTDAIRASYQLVGHLSRFGPAGPEGRLAFFSANN